MNTKTIGTKTQPKFDTLNEAGGQAFSLSDKESLAQLALTGTFNNTFYTSAEDQLATFKKMAQKCDSRFIAQLAVYARNEAYMKDTPAVLLAILVSRGELEIVKAIFNRVITNGRMLRNFVQCIRSGEFGRKSFGSATKRLIQDWLVNRTDEQLVLDSVGNSPSLADIIKMVHPPHREVFAYLIGKNKEYRPTSVHWMSKTSGELSSAQWKEIALNDMGYLARIKNINTLYRNECFDDAEFTARFARLINENVPRFVMPYELFAAYTFIETDVPARIRNAVSDAMETACRNVPEFDTDPIICIDISGSMSSPVTGYRAGATSKMTCTQAAAMFASALLRVNRNGQVIPFDTSPRLISINPNDTIATNASKLSVYGGGTACASALAYANMQQMKSDLVIYISDNMSWADYGRSGNTGLAGQWQTFKRQNRNAKLVLIDIQPYTSTQVQTDKDVLNVGGFNDQVFRVIKSFMDRQTWVEKIEESVEI